MSKLTKINILLFIILTINLTLYFNFNPKYLNSIEMLDVLNQTIKYPIANNDHSNIFIPNINNKPNIQIHNDCQSLINKQNDLIYLLHLYIKLLNNNFMSNDEPSKKQVNF